MYVVSCGSWWQRYIITSYNLFQNGHIFSTASNTIKSFFSNAQSHPKQYPFPDPPIYALEVTMHWQTRLPHQPQTCYTYFPQRQQQSRKRCPHCWRLYRCTLLHLLQLPDGSPGSTVLLTQKWTHGCQISTACHLCSTPQWVKGWLQSKHKQKGCKHILLYTFNHSGCVLIMSKYLYKPFVNPNTPILGTCWGSHRTLANQSLFFFFFFFFAKHIILGIHLSNKHSSTTTYINSLIHTFLHNALKKILVNKFTC